MSRLELLAFVYVFGFSAFFLSMMWWTPPSWLTIPVGLVCAVLGVGFVVRLWFYGHGAAQ